jgi:glycosyltransferase involved in cell wall biosynthesis
MLATAYAGQRGPMEVAAEGLRRAGHEVDVVRIAVRRSRPGGGVWERVPGFLANGLTALRAAATRRRYDRIMVDTSPPLAFAPLVPRARLRGEELVLLHYDIFPENVTALGVHRSGPALRALGAATHWLARRAHAHRTLSPAMAATLAEALGPGVRIEIAPLPPPPEIAPVPRAANHWLREQGLADRFVVMYAGNLGRAYDFAPMLEAARELASPSVHLPGPTPSVPLPGPTPSVPLPTREGEASSYSFDQSSCSPSPAGKGAGDGSCSPAGKGAGDGFCSPAGKGAGDGSSREIAFVFVGAGYQEDVIRNAAARCGNVILLPPQPEERLAEVLSAGDVHVVPLRPGADRVMWPHKVDAIRAAGRPVLAVGWGEGVDGVQTVAADGLAAEIAKRAEAAR